MTADIAVALRASIDAHKALWLDPPILQPAALYLELSGEDIRRRAFLIDDHAHGELCLRPDMTVPAVRAAFAQATPPFLIAYEGLVFRRQEPGSQRETEFTQIGAEWLGDVDDAAIISAALTACRAANVEPRLRLGDVAIPAAFVDALGLDAAWSARVKRALARPNGLALLRNARPIVSEEGAGLAEAFAALPEDHAEAALLDLLALARIARITDRPTAEIAQRLRARGQIATSAGPNAAQFDLLDALLHIEAPNGLEQAASLLKSPAIAHRASAEAALKRADARLSALRAKIDLPADFSFAPGLGRTLSYYDGFVFELEARALGNRASLGGGGRYDSLAHALWPQSRGRTPDRLAAAGFALRPQRLAEARG